MTLKWLTRRPILRLWGSWDGDNLSELEAAFPNWTFTANQDGTLHIQSGEVDGNIPQGAWFTDDLTSDVDPTTWIFQDAPGPGPVVYDLTAE